MNIRQRLYAALPTPAYLRLRWNAYRRARPDSFPYRQADRHIDTSTGYSLKPFDDTRSLFVHVPKCAGVSVCRALYGNLAGGHTTLSEYIEILEPACILDYFKFTIVRNPWDRLVSAWHFLKAGGFSEAEKHWFDRELGGYRDFDDFVRGWVNPVNVWTYHHFRPQHHYVLNPKRRVKLDFVGLFENLDNDFPIIANRVAPRPVARLRRSNSSERRTHENYYSRETRQIVAEVYAEDIRLLGYDFDNDSLNDQIRRRSAGDGALF